VAADTQRRLARPGLFAARIDDALAEARLRRGGRVIRLVVFLAVLTVLALGGGFLGFVSMLDAQEAEEVAPADAIVVLTGGSDRIADAVQLLAEGRGARLLISGVNPGIAPATLARRLPDYADLFGCCIDFDYGAHNTVSNAAETRRWTRKHNVRTILLVTANYHMPRALIEFRRAMPTARIIARPVIPYGFEPGGWWRNAGTARVLGGEYLKFLAAYARAIVAPVIAENPSETGLVRSLDPR
jgi:uncharacterized SAM-binding protein YcdF (DUF218 family)